MTVNFSSLAKQLEKEIQKDLKQVRFAAMRALNNVSFQARVELMDQYAKAFTVRNANLPKATKVNKASKENLTATIEFPKDWMYLNTVGGEKRATSGKLAFAGSEIDKGNARTASGKIKTSQKPGALLKYADAHPTGKQSRSGSFKAPKAFKVEGKHGYQVIGIRSAAGNGENARKVKWLYSIQQTAKIVKKWDFEQIVRKIALEKLPGEFEIQLKKAMATAK